MVPSYNMTPQQDAAMLLTNALGFFADAPGERGPALRDDFVAALKTANTGDPLLVGVASAAVDLELAELARVGETNAQPRLLTPKILQEAVHKAANALGFT